MAAKNKIKKTNKHKAYAAQSKSLKQSNVIGQSIEEIVMNLTGAKSERLFYEDNLGPKKRFGADLQTDCVLTDKDGTKVILSITHTKPDSRGHSNENKFQLKLGELWLFKTYDPAIRIGIVVGGKKEDWLPWCLEAFKLFFDAAIFQWEEDFQKKIRNWNKVKHKHIDLWNFERKVRQKNMARIPKIISVPDSFLRENIFNKVVSKYFQKIDSPSEIENDILKRCMTVAHKNNSAEWVHFRKSKNSGMSLANFWEKRSFFNPSESSVDLTLSRMGNHYLGGIATDVLVENFMSRLAKIKGKYEEFNRTKMSEDFVLKGIDKHGQSNLVYIQCKSSGGGLERHGKNIQNRAKEQIARGLLYRADLQLNSKDNSYKLVTKEQDWIWLGIVDGNWGTTQVYPEKYIHLLYLAGYNFVIPADSLIDSKTVDFIYPNPLSKVLKSLQLKWDIIDIKDAPTTHDEGEHGKPSGEKEDYDY